MKWLWRWSSSSEHKLDNNCIWAVSHTLLYSAFRRVLLHKMIDKTFAIAMELKDDAALMHLRLIQTLQYALTHLNNSTEASPSILPPPPNERPASNIRLHTRPNGIQMWGSRNGLETWIGGIGHCVKCLIGNALLAISFSYHAFQVVEVETVESVAVINFPFFLYSLSMVLGLLELVISSNYLLNIMSIAILMTCPLSSMMQVFWNLSCMSVCNEFSSGNHLHCYESLHYIVS